MSCLNRKISTTKRIMNKQTILTALLALVALTGQGQAFTWRIEGTMANATQTDTLIVIDVEKQSQIATLQVKDGNIIPASGTLEEPAICCIAKQGRPRWIRVFVLESGTVNLHIDLDLIYLIHIGGTPVNDDLMTMLAVQNMNMDLNTYFKKMYETVNYIVSRHPDHPISPYLIGQCQMTFTPTETIGLIERLSPKLQTSLKMQRLKENLQLAQDTEEGKIFKELTGKSPEGKPTALSEYVGKGNYVLADFWASWCEPCIAEMPNIIALYEKYKDRGLHVIGITIRDAPEKSDSIVLQMGIPFPQIYESKPMSIYGVTGIPHKILFAPDGTILSRRIMSSKELDKKLAEVFQDK